MGEREADLQVVEAEVVDRAIVPAETVESFERRLTEMREFTKRNMVKGTDYGVIPGTQKPTLLKPGVEKLLRWHRLVVDLHVLPSSRLDVKGDVIDIDVEGIVRHASTGTILGTVHANANSEERRYRNARHQGRQTLADQKNTLFKMADKRAWVAAALLYTMASEAYTQDVEDTAGLDGGADSGSPENAERGCCPAHKVPFVHKQGIRRDGSEYDFWGCPRKNADGSWCKERPKPVADATAEPDEPDADNPFDDAAYNERGGAPPDTEDVDGKLDGLLRAAGASAKAKQGAVYGKWARSVELSPMPATWKDLTPDQKGDFGTWLEEWRDEIAAGK